MATRTWTGAVSNLWNVAGNWDTLPSAGDDLVFPSSASNKSNSNDFTADTSFNSITIQGTGYTLAGNRITLGAGGITQTTGTNTISLAIVLGANVTVAISTTAITLSGGITGTANLILATSSSGTITISTTSINHTGTITNSGTGTGTTTISAVIGSNVTAVVQNSTTSQLTISGAGTIANCSDKFQITKGTLRLSTTNTVANLFVDATGCTDKTAQLMLAANQTVTGEFKPRGSGVNRLLVTSETLGTAQTITITGATISNSQAVDFRDITFANGGSNVNLSAITGGSGDCGGNTISGGGVLSFTTADDWYWYSASGGTYNLSDRTYWFTATNGGGTQMGADRGPLPQDMLYVDGSSINGTTTIDQDMPRMPGIDFTGCDAVALHMDNVSQSVYGSLVISDSVDTPSISFMTTFENRSSAVFRAGDLNAVVDIRAIGGSVTLSGNLSNVSFLVTLRNGTFDADIYNIYTSSFVGSGTSSRTLRMGNGAWTIFNGNWTFNTITNLTSLLVGETSTLTFGLATSTTTKYVYGGGLTYHNLSIPANTTGTQQITISDNNTFNELTINGPKTVNFTAGSVQTVASLVTTGTGIVLKSTSSGSPWYLVDPSGTNQVSNATISDSYPRGSDAGGGALWDADVARNNVDGGGNVAHDSTLLRGWKFIFGLPIFGRGLRRGGKPVFGGNVVRR